MDFTADCLDQRRVEHKGHDLIELWPLSSHPSCHDKHRNTPSLDSSTHFRTPQSLYLSARLVKLSQPFPFTTIHTSA